jgi:signal transduction histidine kinase
MKRNRTIFFAYILGIYVFLQFIWWGFQLIALTQKVSQDSDYVSKRIWMIFGEGGVFILILIIGLNRMIKAYKQESRSSEAQNNFMLAVTHELKTPISAVKLNLQTANRTSITSVMKNELIENALAENTRLENLVEQILTASRLEQNEIQKSIETIDLNEFLIENITLFSKRSELKIDFKERAKSKSLTDKFLLETILQNLFENAAKYANTPYGLEVNILETELTQKIFIRDFGPGIPKNKERDIFKKFYRLENEETRQTKGTGLGLFIAHACAQALGGELSVNTAIGTGSCFELKLPKE